MTFPANEIHQPSAEALVEPAGIEKQCRITATPSARARSVAIVSSSAARVWMTSGLPVARASSICAWKARSWSARGAQSR